jgi:hypothetical protein
MDAKLHENFGFTSGSYNVNQILSHFAIANCEAQSNPENTILWIASDCAHTMTTKRCRDNTLGFDKH